MRENASFDLGLFEGFNFRSQSAIDRLLSAEEVLNWDHDADGEAEFWPDGSNPFVKKLLPGSSCSAEEVRQVARIVEELDGEPTNLAKAVYLRDRGDALETISREIIDEACLYVFGPGWFFELQKEAALELFELLWPDAYKLWEEHAIPGLQFDSESFLEHFSTLELKLAEGGYLVVDTE